MSLHFLRTRRLPDSPGAETGLPYVDIVAPLFQAPPTAVTNFVLTLPAAAGAGDVSPALVVNTAAVQGDCVTGVECLTGGGLDAGLGICGGQVTTAGGPLVGQITIRVVNPTVANIPLAAADRTFRVFLDR